MMKVLVTYFTQTGNTEKIAKAIHGEASKTHTVQLKKIEEVKPESLSEYDLVFVGAPVHAGGLAAAAQEFLAKVPSSPKLRLAGFVTHSSPAYQKENFDKALELIVKVSKEKGIRFEGTYDCVGFLSPDLHSLVKQMRNVSDEEWAKLLKEMTGHPNNEDEQKAREFAKKILSKS